MNNIVSKDNRKQIPKTIEGITDFLMSIDGVGIKTVNVILHNFKLKSWYVIHDYSYLLEEIKGIGPKRQKAIQKTICDLYAEDIVKFD